MVTGDAEQVFDLHLRGDQQRVNRALIERIEQGQNWRGINRAIPHVRCQLEDVGAARAKRLAEARVRFPVQLNRHCLSVDVYRLERLNDLGRGVRRRSGDVDADAESTEYSGRLGPPYRDGGRGESAPEIVLATDEPRRLEDRGGADTGEEDRHGEIGLAHALDLVPQRRSVGQVNLAQTRRRERHAVVALDQIRQLGRTAAFEESHHATLQVSHGRQPAQQS